MTIHLPTTAELSIMIFGYTCMATAIATLICVCIFTKGNQPQEKDHHERPGNDSAG